MILAWITINPLNPNDSSDWLIWLIVIPIIVAFLITGMPAFIAPFHSGLRAKLYTSSVIGGASLFTLSFLISLGILVSMEVILSLIDAGPFFYHRQPSPNNFLGIVLMPIFTGFLIGIIVFPLTFGIVFPFAIPIMCALGVWATIDEHHNISRKAWGILMAISTLGWIFVAVIGYALGNA